MKKYLLFILTLCLLLVGCQKKEELLKTSTEIRNNSKAVLEIYGNDDAVSKIVFTTTASKLNEEEIKEHQNKFNKQFDNLKDKKFINLDQKIENDTLNFRFTLDTSKREYISELVELKLLPESVKTNDKLTLNEVIKIYETQGFVFD